MPSPAELLQAITDEITPLLADDAYQPQQITFIKHIQKTTSELLKATQPMPSSALALQRIIPTLGDSFLQQQAALFGYAKLLLDHPESFGGASLTSSQQYHMRRIYEFGQSLYELTEEIQKSALKERIQQQKAQAVRVELAPLLQAEIPILNYVVSKKPVQLTLNVNPVAAITSPYHLSALLQHIVTVLSHELMAYGHIQIKSYRSIQSAVIDIFCTGIQLDTEEVDTLFSKNGRYLYPRRLQKDGGSLHFVRDVGRGASVQIHLPV